MRELKQLMSMQGRRALITGGGGHLGRTIADTLAQLGAEVILVDVAESRVQAVAGEINGCHGVRAAAMVCDLEDECSRIALFEEVRKQGLAVLINNAAFGGDSKLEGWAEPFENQSIDSWRRAIEVNLTAGFHLSQLFAPSLAVSPGGSIINIASIYGQLGPDYALYTDTAMANPAAYGASKGGLIQLTRWLSTTLAPKVRANAISPGGIFRGQPESFVKRYCERTPLRRMANEDDFRGAVAYLASDLSSYVTGQVLAVDGGWSSW